MVNNKGMTLVELIVTFSLLLIIIIGMFNIIMEIKSQLDEKQVAKDFTEYSATMNNKIHYEFIKSGDKKPSSFVYKKDADSRWQTAGRAYINEEQSDSIVLFDDETTQNNAAMLDKECKNIFPCLIYGYYEDRTTKKVLAIQVPNGDEKEYGIYYDGVFEPVPNQDYIDIEKIRNNTSSDKNEEPVAIEITDEEGYKSANINNITISFPLYIKGHEKNYGFKMFSRYTSFVKPS